MAHRHPRWSECTSTDTALCQLFFRKSQRNPSPFQASWVMTNPFSFGLLFLHFAVNVGEWATQPTLRHLARADYMALVWRFGP